MNNYCQFVCRRLRGGGVCVSRIIIRDIKAICLDIILDYSHIVLLIIQIALSWCAKGLSSKTENKRIQSRWINNLH